MKIMHNQEQKTLTTPEQIFVQDLKENVEEIERKIMAFKVGCSQSDFQCTLNRLLELNKPLINELSMRDTYTLQETSLL